MKKKAHKTRRQIQAEKLAAATRFVQKANRLTDPLESLTKFHKFTTKNGTSIDLSCTRVKNLPPETIKWIFDLMERNMKTMYEQSAWGWNEEAKQTELTEDTAWYLIASSEGKMIGFSHFRFDLDNSVAVLYCYELQLEPSIRHQGLGRFMMQCLETIAAKNQMEKVVLTVLKCNLLAISFFDNFRYKLDITNPPSSDGVDHVILSKMNLQQE